MTVYKRTDSPHYHYDFQFNARTRRRLDHDLECALSQFERQVELRIPELRGPGHA
jgi:hypothetical protein